MRFKIIIAPLVKKDLVSIANYTVKTFGEKQMEIYLSAIDEKFKELSKNPRLGHNREDLAVIFFSLKVGQHMVIYSIDEQKLEIQIVRILHSRMDFTKRL